MKQFRISLLLCLSCFSFLNAQTDTDYYNPSYIRFEDFVYRENIKSVVLEGAGAPLSDATIELNSNQQLKLSFDELDADIKDYSYSIIHCDNKWQPSEISESQYIQGFSTDKIINYKASSGALMPYIHYELLFPNEVVKPVITGNFVIKVFDSSNPDSLILTKRFTVFEQKVLITYNLHQATFSDKRFSHQEVDFTINTGELNLVNPYADLHVVITQNGRWDNAITGLKPLFVKGDLLDYNYDNENCFDGGNEYRTFDIRSIRYQSEHIRKIELDPASGIYEVFLLPDERISSQRYSFQNDINGKYLIKHTEGHNSDIDGDYVKVHFKLKMIEPESRGNIYVLGALTNWKADGSSMISYNDSSKMYELTLLLKQGYYNYQYVFIEDGKTIPDASLIEGSHFETENDYAILVYYRNPLKRYDELIGLKKFNSAGK